jgi:predicted lipase
MSLTRALMGINSNEKGCAKIQKKIKQCARLSKYIYRAPSDVLVNETQNELIITIEGTDTLSNWIDNLSIGLKKNDIHKGFYRYSTQCVRKYNLIDVVKKNEKPLYICGHSLGAAAATVILFKLAMHVRDKECYLILFGSPKPGGKMFSQEFAKRLPNVNVYNYQNPKDFVCKFPMFFGFSHINEEVFYTSNIYFFFYFLKNHDMDTYINGIDMLNNN